MVFIYPVQQLLEGKVASLGDFFEVKKLCNSQFKGMVKDKSIEGVIFYSPSYTELHYSDAEDYYTSGSRLGCVVALKSRTPSVLQKLHELEERTKEKNVRLEYTLLLRIGIIGPEPVSAKIAEIARAGRDTNAFKPDAHGLSPSLLQQLKNCSNNGCVIGNNPLNMISPRTYSHEELVGAFVGKYYENLKELENSPILPRYGEEHCLFLENVVKYTLLTAKEMLFLKNQKLPTNGSMPVSDSELVNLYLAEFGDKLYIAAKGENNSLSQVLKLKMEYRAFLDNFLRHGKLVDWVNPAKYTSLLDRIADAYSGAKTFTEQNIEYARKMPANGPITLP
jgi:hypothetical protein